MKFVTDNKKVKDMENTISDINNVKNNCSRGGLQDFIHIVNTFNNMCNDDVKYFCSKKGYIYDNENHRTFGYNDVVSYGIEGDKLILYVLINELEKIEYDKTGQWRYVKINK
ncbi:hypothetical protein RBU49_03020 [Clostridium sp. MB40-C1]|uniref:hypothetical protein n=1 Tax=Clostridium sp. MB40-C1 TaxID=3070996 RepID=UPI0027E11E94|nr:hypothetical protein [Clostridium sp. MB40-C1]WMJ81242.1 hypothetical protein RBU49_03020 [Clostridium sp. MB40-C1]